MAKVVNDYVPEVYMEAVPTAGSIASVKMYGKGELEGCYCGLWNLVDVYKGTGPFEKEPYAGVNPKPEMGFFTHTSEDFLFVRADRTDIKCWRDLAGKTVDITFAGTSIYERAKCALEVLGIWDKINVVDIPLSSIPDALKMGTIDACFG